MNEYIHIDDVAKMLEESFGDKYACNYNGNDEWLPYVCEFAQTTCPDCNQCWKQFVLHFNKKDDILNKVARGEL